MRHNAISTLVVRRKQRRSGWTLIEATVVMSMISTLMLVSTSLIFVLLNLDGSMAEGTAYALTLHRLEDQLREDTYYASAAESKDEGLLISSSKGESILYQIEQDKVTRTISGGVRKSKDAFIFLNSKPVLSVEPQRVRFELIPVAALEEYQSTSELNTKGRSIETVLFPVRRAGRFTEAAKRSGNAVTESDQ